MQFLFSSRHRRILLSTTAAICMLGALPAQAAPPQLYDADVPTQVLVGNKVTFRVGFKDADGDMPKSFTCTIDGPGGQQKKQYTSEQSKGIDAATGFVADFSMGPLSLDGQYSVRFAATTGDGNVESPPQKFVVVNTTRRWYDLAIGVVVCLTVLPLLTFLFMRIIAPRKDPRAAARFGLIAGVAAAYAWYIFLFGALHQGIGIGAGALVTLAAIIALASGSKSAPKTK